MSALGVEYGCKYTLIGPDGTEAVFNDESDPAFVGVLSPESSGLDSAEIREDSADIVEGDGAIHGNFYSGRRPVVLQGTILALTKAQRNERVERLQRASLALRGDATLSWQTEGGPAVSIKLRRQQRLAITKGFVKEFQLPMVAADPRIYNAPVNATINFLLEEGFISGLEGGTAGLAIDSGHIYWSSVEKNKIGRATIAGGSIEQSFITLESGALPRGIAVDSGHIYWAASGKNKIGRATIAGGTIEQSFITLAAGSFPRGIAVDSGHIYWASQEANKIGRATIAGGTLEQSFITLETSSSPIGLAIDSGHIYWGANSKNKIGRATIAGGTIEQSFITLEASSSLTALAVDSGHIYWAASGKNKIGRATLAGSSVEETFVQLGAENFFGGIAIDSEHIYWASQEKNKIGRCKIALKGAVTLEGTASSPPILYIVGPVTNPVVTNSTTGRSFSLNYTIAAEDFVAVNFDKKTVVKADGVTDLSYAVNFPTSEWWELQPGTNEIAANAEVVVEYKSAWL